jgi:hypothetical protein
MKKIFIILSVLIFILMLLPACGEKESGPSQMLSFSSAQSVSEMKKLDGKQVTIIGYMSTLSPVSGKFMYLMNLPYQSCPFCIPNTTQLSNTMAVYAKDEFTFTDRAIKVTGIMDFGDYTDEFGYQYSYRIKNATYTILDTSDMTEELKLWQQIASTDVIADIYTMFEYVNYLCYWPTYTMEFSEGKDYLYPTEALMFVEEEGAQFNYGFKDGYFETIIATIESVDKTAFSDLVKVVNEAKTLSQKGYEALKTAQYEAVTEYSDVFGDGRVQYRILIATELEQQMEAVYMVFSNWLSSWEL